jgi:tRNA-binding protein
MINFEDFEKVDLRIVKIISVSRIEDSEKLLKIEVEINEEKRIILAGIAKFYSPDELVNKNVVIVANLEPKTMFGVESQGMILAVKDKDNLSVLVPDREVKNGLKIT